MSDSLARKHSSSRPDRPVVGRVLKTRHGELDLCRRTALMGVLNVTPDSFSDGGQFLDSGKAIERGVKLVAEGADIIDVGGESTRPGAQPVSVEEEIGRVIPVIRGLRARIQVPLSIDTYKVEVARRALAEGADIVNDISAMRLDARMASLVADEKVPVVLMHMQGMPRTMQLSPDYMDVVGEVTEFLRLRAQAAVDAGVDPAAIVIDPGIGFGKSLEHNLTLLRDLPVLGSLGFPVLVGVSRKTFIGKILAADPEHRLEGSLAAACIAVWGGARIVRVHDLQQTFQALRIVDAILAAPGGERNTSA